MSFGGRGILLERKRQELAALEQESATPPIKAAQPGLGRGILRNRNPHIGSDSSSSTSDKDLENVIKRLENLSPQSTATPPPSIGLGRGILRGRPKPAEDVSCLSTPAVEVHHEPSVPPTAASSRGPSDRVPRRPRFELDNVASNVHGGHSSGGKPVDVTTNYIQMECAPNQVVYQYHVFFEPSMESRGQRMKMIYTLDPSVLNGVSKEARIFDGRTLYSPRPITADPTEEMLVVRTSDTANRVYSVSFTLVAKAPLESCRTMLNVLFKRIQGTLMMVQVGRNYFQPKNKIDLKNLNLEVWPGYVASLARYEGGLMLMCDVSHRVVRMDTVHDLMSNLMSASNSSSNQFRQAFTEAVVGTSVLTRYNNRTYRVDDIAFNTTPLTSFTTSGGETTTYQKYYKQQYDITIKDLAQPMLISKCKVPKQKRATGSESGRGSSIPCSSSVHSASSSGRGVVPSEPEVMQLFLVPELCYQTGLNDNMRNNFQLMRSLHEHTRASPLTRWDALMKFAKNCRETPDAARILDAWNLNFAPTSKSVTGYQLPQEQIIYGRGRTGPAGESAEFKRDIGRMPVIRAVPVNNWLYIYQDRDERCAADFLVQLKDRGRFMGISFSDPIIARIDNDRTDTYLQKIHEKTSRQTQLVVCLMRVAREDRYNAIKKVLYTEKGIASQMILCKTIGDPKKLSSVATNIALQITAKLGGELWAVSVPFPKIMVMGIDVYHEGFGQSRRSVGGLVGSLNNDMTRYYSQANFQAPGQEMIDVLCPFVGNLMKHFFDRNHFLPETIVVYRDGVSDSQLREVQDVEVKRILGALEAFARDFQPDYRPQMVFQVVQKRITTRLFGGGKGKDVANPTPGVVVDKVITRPDAYDFFLVPQSVRQGTATPSHYVVVHDSTRLTPNNVQALAFKSCHLYYNWPGTIRVPAACQYAHKLAYMVGCNLRAPPKEDMRENLFYL